MMRTLSLPAYRGLGSHFFIAFMILSGPFRVFSQPSLNDARVLYELGKFQLLIDSFRETAEPNQLDSQSLYLIGRSFYQLHDFRSAAEVFERCVDSHPENPDCHLWLGRATVQKGLLSNIFKRAYLAPKAKRAFENAVQSDSLHRVARHDLLRYYLIAPSFLGGSLTKARQQAKILQQIDEWEGYKAYSTIYLVRKDFEQAERELLTAIRKYPSDIQFYRFLATVYQESQQYEKLIQTCYRAIETFPGEKNEWKMLAEQIASEKQRNPGH